MPLSSAIICIISKSMQALLTGAVSRITGICCPVPATNISHKLSLAIICLVAFSPQGPFTYSYILTVCNQILCMHVFFHWGILIITYFDLSFTPVLKAFTHQTHKIQPIVSLVKNIFLTHLFSQMTHTDCIISRYQCPAFIFSKQA